MNDIETHRYAVADAEGRISWVTSGPYLYIACDESVSDDTHYVDIQTGEIEAKQAFDIQPVIEGLTVTLAGLPAGLAVVTNGMDTLTDDDPLVITYDVPGTYEITLRGHVEYLDRVEEVTVGDA